MPKFSKGFARRKSTSNALEEIQNIPAAESSFRVIERRGPQKSFDGGVKLARAVHSTSSPIHDEENIFKEPKESRSETSTLNTGSTTDLSSGHSADSTAPSINDLQHHKEIYDKSSSDIPPSAVRSSSAFSLKAAGRAISFGRGKSATPSPSRALDDAASPVQLQALDDNSFRPRNVTSSTYASTATPPKLDDRELDLDLDGDFGNMFSDFGKRNSKLMGRSNVGPLSRSPELNAQEPAIPSRTYSPPRLEQPSPNHLGYGRKQAGSPYSATDRLMSSASPLDTFAQYRDSPPPVPKYDSPPSTPKYDSPPPVPKHDSPPPTARKPARNSTIGIVRDNHSFRRQSKLMFDDDIDEDARMLRDSLAAARRVENQKSVTARMVESQVEPPTQANSAEATAQEEEPQDTTSLLTKVSSAGDSVIDEQLASSALLADAYNQKPQSPPKSNLFQKRVMTPAQFERYKRDQERSKASGGRNMNDDDDEDITYDDVEDEVEKRKQIAKQRRKQEAHMTVYRQQMMKVTGEAPSATASSRSGLPASFSTPNLSHVNTGENDDDEDEEVPLAILAAHGFPNKDRAPGQLPSTVSTPNLFASNQSMVGGPAGGSRLPVFARNLPQDPYFGSSLVNSTTRESLAYGGGAPSPQASVPSQAPGGLVNVIANEERSRAMRRGSPNAAGEYGPPPSNGFNGMASTTNLQVPPMMRGMTTGSIDTPMGAMGPPGHMMPADQMQVQMAQQMQQFMQMQMQFMQMQMGAGTPTPQAGRPMMDDVRTRSMIDIPSPADRPNSMYQRAMTGLDPTSAPWRQPLPQRHSMFMPSSHINQSGYTPSIAPSERSNVGQPGRYRPVSSYPTDPARASSFMSGALQNWATSPNIKQGDSMVKVVSKASNPSDDDDEEGWEAMKRKREKRKSQWKSKKENASMLGY